MRTAETYRRMVEEALIPQLESLGNIPEILKKAMSYSLSAGGKRLRPVLLLATAEAAGISAEEALPYACALEMIHTYSLIHDDLPAMDNDDLRRGKPTNHKVFGDGVAVLAGDGLLNAAMELMLRDAVRRGDIKGIKAAEIIARRAGVTGMIAGQTIDVTEEGSAPSEDKVRYIHLHKTGDLLTAPMEAAMALAGADPVRTEAAIAFGQHYGMAFQMVDDLLDVVGDAAVLGKNTGMDATLGKMTWPAVYGMEKTRKDIAAETEKAVAAAEVFEDDSHFFSRLAREAAQRVS